MPKATFFNLNEEKKNRILDAAVDAFSQADYSEVTVSAIVKDAGIPKGSFYQYFEDKFDLFYHIILMTGELKKSYFTPVFAGMHENNFFDTLGEMYKSGIAFALDNPKYAQIGSLLMKSNDSTLVDRIYKNMGGQVENFLRPFLEAAIEKGELRDDLDVGFLSHMFGQFNMVFADYFFKVKDGSDYKEYVKDIDMMLDLFKHGAMKKS